MSSQAYDVAAGFPAVYIPEQKPPPDLGPEESRVTLCGFPPLGQVTTIAGTTPFEASFLMGLGVHRSQSEKPWQVALSLSMLGEGAWADVLMHPSSPAEVPISLRGADDPDDPATKLYFSSAQLALQSATCFTVKFRESPELPWRLARDELQLEDGILLHRPQSKLPDDAHELIKGLPSEVVVTPVISQCPGTGLWVLEVDVEGVDDGNDQSVFANVELGVPWGSNFLRWFALVRAWSPWLAPRHGKTEFVLDKDAVMCSFLNCEGKHLVLLAVSGVGHVTTVLQSSRAGGGGGVVLHVRSDSTVARKATVLLAVGDDFEKTNAAVMYHARDMVRLTMQQSGQLDAEMDAEVDAEVDADLGSLQHDGVRPGWMEQWYDGLGFCTWNALGQRLTEEKVLEALDILTENNIMITTLIIDDNWQNIDYKGDGQFQYGWNDFEAEPKAFPRGLKEMVSAVRSKHPNIQHVAVWHALLGYWGGISPDGKLARSYKTVEVMREDAKRRNLPLGGKMTVIAKGDVARFYDDFYRFLSTCGVDGVKTDAQFMIDSWVGASARRELASAYLDAWTLSSLRHFSIRAISCMSQTPHILFYSQLPRHRPAMLVRNSDDFFPDIPASHPWHVWTNAYNSLLTQHLNILPDWDMFQTSHNYSRFHAAARCLSGGPIYITDVPGEHDMDLIGQMTGLTTRGKTVIFRPSVLGKAVDHYVGYGDDALLKIGTYHGALSAKGTPILGLFNTTSRMLTDIVPLHRFPGVHPSTEYVVRSHQSGRCTVPIKAKEEETPPSSSFSSSTLLSVTLPVRGYDIFTAFPLSSFEGGVVEGQGNGQGSNGQGSNGQGQRVLVANLGLLGKMAGTAAVVSSDVKAVNGRVFLRTRIKALGVLGIYISSLPEMPIADTFLATILGSVVPPATVTVSKQDSHVLAIDVEAAWKQMDLDSGWSNELELKLYITIPGNDSRPGRPGGS